MFRCPILFSDTECTLCLEDVSGVDTTNSSADKARRFRRSAQVPLDHCGQGDSGLTLKTSYSVSFSTKVSLFGAPSTQ